jgi:hypothetical protein
VTRLSKRVGAPVSHRAFFPIPNLLEHWATLPLGQGVELRKGSCSHLLTAILHQKTSGRNWLIEPMSTTAPISRVPTERRVSTYVPR